MDEIADAMADSFYLAGLKAGWNMAMRNDEEAYRIAVKNRDGYLKPILEKRHAEKDTANAR
jgi:hypothetical protein